MQRPVTVYRQLTSAIAPSSPGDTSWCVSCRVFALGVLDPDAVAVPWYASGCSQGGNRRQAAHRHGLLLQVQGPSC